MIGERESEISASIHSCTTEVRCYQAKWLGQENEVCENHQSKNHPCYLDLIFKTQSGINMISTMEMVVSNILRNFVNVAQDN